MSCGFLMHEPGVPVRRRDHSVRAGHLVDSGFAGHSEATSPHEEVQDGVGPLAEGGVQDARQVIPGRFT